MHVFRSISCDICLFFFPPGNPRTECTENFWSKSLLLKLQIFDLLLFEIQEIFGFEHFVWFLVNWLVAQDKHVCLCKPAYCAQWRVPSINATASDLKCDANVAKVDKTIQMYDKECNMCERKKVLQVSKLSKSIQNNLKVI